MNNLEKYFNIMSHLLKRSQQYSKLFSLNIFKDFENLIRSIFHFQIEKHSKYLNLLKNFKSSNPI